MTHSPIPPLGHLNDEELASLAATWRTRAGFGQREAFGMAHALEVELRRRTRNSNLQALPSAALPTRRRWWRFWSSSGGRNERSGPMMPT